MESIFTFHLPNLSHLYLSLEVIPVMILMCFFLECSWLLHTYICTYQKVQLSSLSVFFFLQKYYHSSDVILELAVFTEHVFVIYSYGSYKSIDTSFKYQIPIYFTHMYIYLCWFICYMNHQFFFFWTTNFNCCKYSTL